MNKIAKVAVATITGLVVGRISNVVTANITYGVLKTDTEENQQTAVNTATMVGVVTQAIVSVHVGRKIYRALSNPEV